MATPSPSSVTCRELQRACKENRLPAQGSTEVLRELLESFVSDPEATRERVRQQPKRKRTKRNNDWVDWKNHAARETLLKDLEPGGWLHGKEEDARTVYDIYIGRQEEFRGVPFDQFEQNYQSAIKLASKRRARSAEEEEWMKHDRQLHPRRTHNHRGERVFDMDLAAKAQLRSDVKNKIHKEMKPSDLWQGREVHSKCELDIFRPRIYQEVRRQKFLNCLDKKRKEKRNAFAAGRITFVRN